MDIDDEVKEINIVALADAFDNLVNIVEGIGVHIDTVTKNIDGLHARLIRIDKTQDALGVVVTDLQKRIDKVEKELTLVVEDGSID